VHACKIGRVLIFSKYYALPLWTWAFAEIFTRGGNLGILLILFRLLTMQCKLTFTKRFTFCSPQTKCPILRQQSQKLRFVGSNSRLCYDDSHDNLQIFKARHFFLLFKKALPWSLKKGSKHTQDWLWEGVAIWFSTKPQIMTLFYLARPVSVTLKQEQQKPVISSRTANAWELTQKQERRRAGPVSLPFQKGGNGGGGTFS